ncbi:hypothetical protein IFM89_019247 [Coptis chinensis]|uniref:Uncharacterized protein n=1 Tax=Coptis chinensis TaxID=261450 RepID=A0A835HKX9_9MAGN|nr:hypothetical protein IFM89_019247 [Coptis chinensis]
MRELAAVALSAGSAMMVNSATVAKGIFVEKRTGKDGPTAASSLGMDFYNVILQEEPLKSTTVKQIIKSLDGLLFLLQFATDSSMLSVLLLLSKYRLKSVPITGRQEILSLRILLPSRPGGARSPTMQRKGFV